MTHTVVGLEKHGGYIKARRDLLYGLAAIFHCRVTIAQDRSNVKIYGFASDAQFVQGLFSSLCVQMMRHMEHDAHTMPSTDSPRTWRTSFAHGWADRVVTRLRASRASQERAADTSTPGTALVIRDRSQDVTRYVDQLFGGRRMGSSYKNRSIRSGAGLTAGYAAGERAQLGGSQLGSKPQGELS